MFHDQLKSLYDLIRSESEGSTHNHLGTYKHINDMNFRLSEFGDHVREEIRELEDQLAELYDFDRDQMERISWFRQILKGGWHQDKLDDYVIMSYPHPTVYMNGDQARTASLGVPIKLDSTIWHSANPFAIGSSEPNLMIGIVASKI